MKTRNYLLAILMLIPGTLLTAQKVELNSEASSIEWVGKKVAYKHNGNIQFKSGSFELKDDQIVAGNFVVDMSTITNSDIESEDRNKRLVDHLKSEDFFNVEEFPSATFKVTEGTKFSQGKATLTGDLTIKGTTEPISFEVTKSGNVYTASFDVDRAKYDVRYGSDSFFDNLGDNAISDQFTLNIRVELL